LIGTPLRAGAVSSHFWELGKELVRRGHEVTVIAPSPTQESELGNADLRILRWPSARPTRLADACYLWRLISELRPDVLVANFAPVNWMCLVGWCRRVRCRIAWSHTLSEQVEQSALIDPRKRRMLRLRKSLVYKAATHVAANSQAAVEDLRRMFHVPPDKCDVWSNSLSDPSPPLELRSARARDDLVVCVGRLDRSKGQDVLIDAWGRCHERFPSTLVQFIGSGPTLSALQEQATRRGVSGRCVFLGRVPHAQVLQAMARARVTVVPSRSEAFGLVNIESMAVRTPVIASRVGGIPEIVRDGQDGLLVPPDDPQALADQLARALNDEALRDRLGSNARERFLRVYEQSKVVADQADRLERAAA
jgi:glycosyltransferase involved in cell wall biosynthesis